MTNCDFVTSSYTKEFSIGHKRHASRKRFPLPDGFLFPDEWKKYATEKGLDPPRIAREFEKFSNHHRANGTLFLDWLAAWRKWIGNSIEFAAKSGGGGQGGFKWNGIEGVT